MAVAVALAALAVGGAQAGEGGAEAGEGGLGRRPLFLGNDFIPALTFRNPFAGAELTVAGELSEPQNLFPLLSCSLFGGGGQPSCTGWLLEGLNAPEICISIC